MAKRTTRKRLTRTATTRRRAASRAVGTVITDLGPPLGPTVVISAPKGEPKFTLKEFATVQLHLSDYVPCIKRAVEVARGTKRFPVESWLMYRGRVTSPFGGQVPAGVINFSLKDGSTVVVTVAPARGSRHACATVWVSEEINRS
jgi:hypothetical protein